MIILHFKLGSITRTTRVIRLHAVGRCVNTQVVANSRVVNTQTVCHAVRMSVEREVPPSVGKVVGENLRRLRQERRLTQDAAAAQLLRTGLNWKRTHVSDLESGRRETLDIGALVVLAAAFDVTPRDFFEGTGAVLLTPRAEHPEHGSTATRDQIRTWLSGEKSTLLLTGVQTSLVAVKHADWEARPIAASADKALAEKLDIDPWHVVRAAEQLWGRSLTEERDRRVTDLGDLPVGERQAKQGHITRQLTAVLTKWLGGAGEIADQ